jgi:hypothetical protein
VNNLDGSLGCYTFSSSCCLCVLLFSGPATVSLQNFLGHHEGPIFSFILIWVWLDWNFFSRSTSLCSPVVPTSDIFALQSASLSSFSALYIWLVGIAAHVRSSGIYKLFLWFRVASIFFSLSSVAIISATPSIPNYKSFQESWRIKTSQVWPNLYNKIITFTILTKYHQVSLIIFS